MSTSRWLTPDVPGSGYTCRTLLIPAGIDWLAIVNGCIEELTYASSFEDFGTATAQQTADLFRTMFEQSAYQQNAGCRVIGEIVVFAGNSSPSPDWLPCDGSSVLRASFPALFAVVGTTFGAVDGSHFNLPDLQGRAPIGTGTGSGLSTRNLGDSIGEETHVLTVSELASHNHSESTAVPALGAALTGVPIPSATPGIGFTGSAGADAAHNNMQPSLALSFFIVAR